MALNFQQKSSVVIRGVITVILLAVSIACLVIYAREDNQGPLHQLQSHVGALATPFKAGGMAIQSAEEATSHAFQNTVADESTLTGLREYNAELIEQYAQAEEYAKENERLRALLDMKDSSKVEGVGARVIGRSTEAWSQTVTIDKGSAEGVDSGLTVMASSGVIGQVVSTTDHTATIRLLTDPQSGVSAMVQSSRVEGIVRGSLEGLLNLEYVSEDATVNPGDVVITSGQGGSYTKGLVIGTVVKVEANQGGIGKRIVVSTNDDVNAFEEVLVVTGLSQSDTNAEEEK